MVLLNSFFNPIIYSFRLREFRVAFIELICKTANIAEAEQREMKIFGTPNAVVRIEAGQENEGQARQNVEQWNKKNNDSVDNSGASASVAQPHCKGKDTNGKGRFKRILSFVFVDKRKLFVTKLSFQEFHLTFFTAERLACFGPSEPRHQSFWRNFRYILYSIIKESTFLKGNFFNYKGFINVLYILT